MGETQAMRMGGGTMDFLGGGKREGALTEVSGLGRRKEERVRDRGSGGL